MTGKRLRLKSKRWLMRADRKPTNPQKKETHCTTGEAGDVKTQDCTTVTTPAVPASSIRPAMAITYSAKIILPDGTHAKVLCAEGSDGCGSIESATPERTKETWVGASKTTTGLGMFEAKRNKSEITI